MLKVAEVKGFEKLPAAWAEMFKAFLNNFYQRWGLEARETIVPLKVSFQRDASNGAYLRFDYTIYGRKTWLHVKNAVTWY